MLRLLSCLSCLVSAFVLSWNAVQALAVVQPMEKSYKGPLPELTAAQIELRDLLRRDVERLAGGIGERNLNRYPQLQEAATFVENSFVKVGYKVVRYGYEVQGRKCDNLEVELSGGESAEEIVIVGAHYDSVAGSPGANDNASGVAAMLALARHFAGGQP